MNWNKVFEKAKKIVADELPLNGSGPAVKSAPETKEESISDILAKDDVVSEDKKKEHVKSLKQQGFQIVGLDPIRPYARLEATIESMRAASQLTADQWSTYYGTLIECVAQKRARIVAEIEQLKTREADYDEKIEECRLRTEKITEEIEELVQQLVSIRAELYEANKTLGVRLIEDADKELTKAVELQKTMYREVKVVNEDRHKNTKPALDELVRKWKDQREAYNNRLRVLQEKIKGLADHGIHAATASTLIALGSTMAGVAGYFFAIFSSKAKYSSTDVFYYLLKNIILVSADRATPLHLKFSYLIGALIVITAASWLIDRMILKANFFKKEVAADQSPHYFETKFNDGNWGFSYGVKEKSWLLLWLKIAPFLLVIGSVILLVSNGENIGAQTDELSASTEGLIIGTAIAMGLGAAIYLYLTKITENRASATNLSGHVRRNWELVTAVLIFVLSMAVFAFYRGDSIGTYSIIGFIGTCLIAAFVVAYGLRFAGFFSSAKETEAYISDIDSAIARCSVPYQPYFDININKYLSEVSENMIHRLEKKRADEFDESQFEVVPIMGEGESGKGRIMNVFRTAPEVEADADHVGLFSFTKREMIYFPELVNQIKVLAGQYKDKKLLLKEAESDLKNRRAEKEGKKEHDLSKIGTLVTESEQLDILTTRIEKKKLDRRTDLSQALSADIMHLTDGFQLGLLYARNNMDAGRPPLLLN